MRTRQQIHPFLSRGLHKRLAFYASHKNATQSSVVESALVRYLDEEVTDRAWILRRLDRIEANAANQTRNTELLSQAFGVFVQLWFAHTPRLADDAKAGAEQSAARRYSQFIEHVSTEVASGRSFAGEKISDDDNDDTDLTARKSSS